MDRAGGRSLPLPSGRATRLKSKEACISDHGVGDAGNDQLVSGRTYCVYI